MSPQQLIQQLESLGKIDPKILAKIVQQIKNPDKPVTTKAVLGYLVKNKHLSESEAIAILMKAGAVAPPSSASSPAPSPPPKKKKPDDTDDLTGLLDEPGPTTVNLEKASSKKPTTSTTTSKSTERLPPPDLEPVSPKPLYAGYDLLGHDDELSGYDDGFGSPASAGMAGTSTTGAQLGFIGKKDKRDQWATKWLYIGFGILGTLLIALAVLYIATMGVKAEDQFAAAMASFDKLSYQDAADKFGRYVADNPRHKYVPTAQARRVQAMMRTTYSTKNWSETILRGETLLPTLVETEDSKLEDIREDLGLMLPMSLLEITEKARKADKLPALESELAAINKFKTVIDNPVYIPTSIRNKASVAANLARIDNNIRFLEGQINKEKEYSKAIVEIKGLGNAGETDKAFANYTSLTRNYPDLAVRTELRETMLAISLNERELVKPLDSAQLKQWIVASEPRPSPIQTTVVLASRFGTPAANLKKEIHNFLSDGSLYGIDLETGSLLWRKFVGYQTEIQPQKLDLDSFLAADQKHHDLMRLQESDGKILWRTEIGEPFLKPSFTDGALYITTRSGKLLQLNRETGTVEQAIQLPQAANIPPVVDERHPFIYQIGLYSNLYVFSPQDLSCREVLYLGHSKGSITVPPVFWNGYLLVAVNAGNQCDLQILKPSKGGLELELVQVIARITADLVSTPLQRFGGNLLLTSDQGEVRILELLPGDEKNPVRVFASERFDNSSGQPVFVLSEGSNLWIAGLGISRFRIGRNQGTFQRKDIVKHNDTFLSPPSKLDDTIFSISRRSGSGMLSASLVDADSLAPIWRTDFGGRVVGEPQPTENAVVAVSNQGDLFRIGANEMGNGYAEAIAQASTIVEDLKFDSLTVWGGKMIACLGPAPQEDFLIANPATGQSKLLRLDQPANRPACSPIALGEHLIVPSLDGQVARIDPANGRKIGTPFQPPITPGIDTQWFAPTLMDDGKFAIASGSGTDNTTVSRLFLLNAENTRSIIEVGSFESDRPFKSALVNDGKAIFGVIVAGENDALAKIAIETNLKIDATVDLPGRVVAGPWLIGDLILVKSDDDQIRAIGTDMANRWAMDVAHDQIAGSPTMTDSDLLICFQSGKVLFINPKNGTKIRELDLGQPIASGPVSAGNETVISGLDGTVHRIDLNHSTEANQ